MDRLFFAVFLMLLMVLILSNFLKIADDFVTMFRSRTGYRIVEPAHMVCLHFQEIAHKGRIVEPAHMACHFISCSEQKHVAPDK
jgi:hypothetical protein